MDRAVRAAVGHETSGSVDMLGVEPGIRLEPPARLQLGDWPVRLTIPATGYSGEGESMAEERVVPLSALGKISLEARTARVRRVEGLPAARLQMNPLATAGLDAEQLQSVLAQIPLRADERVSLGGEAAEIRESFAELRLAMVLSLILVFLILAALYESFVLPFLIMCVVPVAMGGALVALTLGGQSLNVMSILGMIILGGIAVNNSIVLVDRMEALSRSSGPGGAPVRAAVLERFRPVMMTAMTTVLGMLPLALVTGAGIELRRSLAVAVLGGILSSTFASLFLLPILHRSLAGLRSENPEPTLAPREH